MTNDHDAPLPDDLEAIDDLDRLEALEPPSTKWPKVIGTISIIYAIGGFLCQAGSAVGTMFSDLFMKMGGIDFEMPVTLKVISGVNLVLITGIGLVLLFGGIKLVRRRPGGVKLHKQWALLRLVMIVIGLVMTIVTLPVQIELQAKIQEFSNDRLRESDREDLIQEIDEDQIWRKTIIQTGIATALFAAYPVFIGFYMSRRKIADEIKTWVV